jgi:hypothetical protein
MDTQGSKQTLHCCQRFLAVAAIGFLAASASAARLNHPQYSASAATPAQKQWNLLCDPAGAVSGSTSTQYSPTIAALNTVTAYAGFEIDDVVVAENDGEGTYTDELGPFPAGTTTVVIVPPEEEELAAAASGGGTVYVSLYYPEVGAVQVFWAPFNPTPIPEISTASVVSGAAKSSFSFFGHGTDVNTHTITFDSLSTDPRQVATFTNYANGSSSFPDYFDTQDGYSGPGFSYTASQILPQTTRIPLVAPCTKGHGDDKGDDKGGDKGGGDDKGGSGKH